MKLRVKLPLLLLLWSLAAAQAPAQSRLAVDLTDPVYQLLELGELKGALSRLSAVKPYSRSEVLRLLERMWQHRELLNPREREILEWTRERIGAAPSGWKSGSYRTGGEGRSLQAGADFRCGARVNADRPEGWTLDSSTRAFLRGDLARWLSYSGSFGFTLDLSLIHI